jgi:hypothetical protein
MIAHDTGHDLVIEDDFENANLIQLAGVVQSECGPIVVQCPFLSDVVHDLGYLIGVDMERALVVFMHRYRPDIIASEERAAVDFESVSLGQKRRYHAHGSEHISDVKYEAWEDQCQVIPHALDVGYESLCDHPLWIEDRTALKFQHEIRQPRLLPAFGEGLIALHNI